MRLDEGLEVVFSIIISDLVAGLDALDRLDADLAAGDRGLRIRAAGMIDVSRQIFPAAAVNCLLGIKRK